MTTGNYDTDICHRIGNQAGYGNLKWMTEKFATDVLCIWAF